MKKKNYPAISVILIALFLAACAQPVNPPAASKPELESDPSKLTGVTWKWVETTGPGGKRVAPPDPAQYTLQFTLDGGLSVQADCNLGTGGYTLEGTALTIHVGILTLATCAKDSLSTQFIQYLNQADSFFFQDGALMIGQRDDGGAMKFIP